MINDYHMLSGIQKVAILFSVVGESLAMSLIKGLSKTEVRKIRSTLRSMGTVSFNVKKRVMEEFYFGFLSEQIDDGKGEDGGPIQPFEFLGELNDEQLIALLDKEDPPVIAMILAQLDPEKKMLILNKLEPALKGQVLIELGSLDDIPLKESSRLVLVSKRSLRIYQGLLSFRGGAKEIADTLSGMNSNEQERYMQTLQNEDPELYAQSRLLLNL